LNNKLKEPRNFYEPVNPHFAGSSHWQLAMAAAGSAREQFNVTNVLVF
jgi:hypothetical protein